MKNIDSIGITFNSMMLMYKGIGVPKWSRLFMNAFLMYKFTEKKKMKLLLSNRFRIPLDDLSLVKVQELEIIWWPKFNAAIRGK